MRCAVEPLRRLAGWHLAAGRAEGFAGLVFDRRNVVYMFMSTRRFPIAGPVDKGAKVNIMEFLGVDRSLGGDKHWGV